MKVYIKLDKFITTISRIISYIGSAWIFAIMLIIVFDVGGRSLFDQPFVGTTEIVRNSVVGIAFFLVPWAMVRDTHVRSTILVDRVPDRVAAALNVMAYGAGFLLFLAIVIRSWDPFVSAFINKDYEGEGALRMLTWPTRLSIIIGSALSLWHSSNIILRKILPSKFTDTSKVGIDE